MKLSQPPPEKNWIIWKVPARKDHIEHPNSKDNLHALESFCKRTLLMTWYGGYTLPESKLMTDPPAEVCQHCLARLSVWILMRKPEEVHDVDE